MELLLPRLYQEKLATLRKDQILLEWNCAYVPIKKMEKCDTCSKLFMRVCNGIEWYPFVSDPCEFYRNRGLTCKHAKPYFQELNNLRNHRCMREPGEQDQKRYPGPITADTCCPSANTRNCTFYTCYEPSDPFAVFETKVRVDCPYHDIERWKRICANRNENAVFEVITHVQHHPLAPESEVFHAATEGKWSVPHYFAILRAHFDSNPAATRAIDHLVDLVVVKGKTLYLVSFEHDYHRSHRSLVREMIIEKMHEKYGKTNARPTTKESM